MMRSRHRVVAAGLALIFLGAWARRRHPTLRPFSVLLSRTTLLPPQARSGVQKRLFKAVYDTLNLVLRRADVGFLNYGYAPTDERVEALELPPEIEPDRYPIQLYDKIAGAIALRGLDVLEVGCGRGGGASFVFERHEPRSMVGLDLSESSIDHCTERYARSGLRFVAGDAERLPFPDASFDIVLNVESSHCYPDTARFFASVARVLRPGGVLLFADLRHTWADGPDGAPKVGDVASLRGQIAAAGLVVVEEEDITANVARALELDSPRRRALIERTPKLMRTQLLDFAGVEGTGIHRAFQAHELSYLRMVLRPAGDAAAPAAA